MPELIRCSCTRINDPWRRFCGGCGHALTAGCKKCGFVNSKHDRFCGGCGMRVAAPIVSHGKDHTMPIDVIEEI